MRVIASAVCVGLMALSVSACGGSGADSSSSAAPSAAPSAAVPAAASSADGAAAAASAPAVAAAGAEPAAFAQCKACHAVEAGKTLVGPSLAGVFGRKAGSMAGFKYTDGFKKLDLSWDEANLDKWLTNPAAMAPGTMMAFPGIADAAQRKAVIDYLKTLK